MSRDQDIARLVGLSCAAIGGAISIVVFCFTTFSTKAEQQVEANHTQAQSQYLREDLQELRSSVGRLDQKIDRLLQRAK